MTQEQPPNQSEVARIKAQIAAEQESAQRAMRSFAYGSSSHLFITRRMERMGALHKALESIVDKKEADQALIDGMEGKQ